MREGTLMIDVGSRTIFLSQPCHQFFPSGSYALIVNQVRGEAIAGNQVLIVGLVIDILFNATVNLVDAVAHVGHCPANQGTTFQALTDLIVLLHMTFLPLWTWRQILSVSLTEFLLVRNTTSLHLLVVSHIVIRVDLLALLCGKRLINEVHTHTQQVAVILRLYTIQPHIL